MNIAIFLPHMGVGGVERSTSILAHQLAVLNHDVTVLSLGSNPEPPAYFKGLKYHHFSARRVSTAIPAIARYLRREKPDAVISAQSYANVGIAIAAKLARFKGKVVLTERLNVSASTGSGRSIKTRLTLVLMRLFYRRADAIVAISQGVATDLAELTHLSPERISVIHNPVNHSDIHSKAREPVDCPWLDDPGSRTIVTVARLERQKNVSSLIEAFAQIVSHPDAPNTGDLRLLIIGDGSERDELGASVSRLRLDDLVKFTGAVSNPYKYMVRSHFFVLSSLYEGLGNVLVEALALKLPVVSTDCPSGPAEILENGMFGILVKPGDTDALAEGMRIALADHESMTAKTEAAQASLNRFTPETAIEKYMALLSADDD